LQGQEGTFAVEPGAGRLDTPRQPLRNVVLVGSMVLSVLVAMSYWMGQLAFLRAREPTKRPSSWRSSGDRSSARVASDRR
jgi:hypothetical protein